MATYNVTKMPADVINPGKLVSTWLKGSDGSDICILDDSNFVVSEEHLGSSLSSCGRDIAKRPKVDRPTRGGRSGPDSMSAAGNFIPCPVCRGKGHVAADMATNSSNPIRTDYYFESYRQLGVHQTMISDRVSSVFPLIFIQKLLF